MLALVSMETALAYIAVCMAVLGLGYGLFSSPNSNAVMGAVEKKDLGIASATLGMMRMSGQMLSMGLATFTLSMFIGSAEIVPLVYGDLVDAVRWAFGAFVVFGGFGVLTSAARGKK